MIIINVTGNFKYQIKKEISKRVQKNQMNTIILTFGNGTRKENMFAIDNG